MTKHADGKLRGEHIRNMGCVFVAGRAELAPQVVQAVGHEFRDEDSADCVEDTLIGLMTNSMGEQSTTQGENHCAMERESCVLFVKSWRFIDWSMIVARVATRQGREFSIAYGDATLSIEAARRGCPGTSTHAGISFFLLLCLLGSCVCRLCSLV